MFFNYFFCLSQLILYINTTHNYLCSDVIWKTLKCKLQLNKFFFVAPSFVFTELQQISICAVDAYALKTLVFSTFTLEKLMYTDKKFQVWVRKRQFKRIIWLHSAHASTISYSTLFKSMYCLEFESLFVEFNNLNLYLLFLLIRNTTFGSVLIALINL